jgi:DNA-binding transcriptional MerR regulator
MKGKHFYTSEVAEAVGVHPNTVRLYEAWGFLPPIPRSAGGYRLFTDAHLDQMHLARTALQGPWPGKAIKEAAVAMVRQAADGDLGGALEEAYHYLTLVQAERARAEAAATLLERWADGVTPDATDEPLWIGDAAELLDVTNDTLRSWERNGLIDVPRDPDNGYRLYGADEIGRLRVIRMLRRAGYSTMAILRMLLQLRRGQTDDLREALDTPREGEDVYIAADRWLSTLTSLEARAREMIAQLEAMLRKRRS